MIKIGDRIKFLSVEEYLNNVIESGRILRKRDEYIQREIAGRCGTIIYVEKLNNSDSKLYHTSESHGGLSYFFHERFKKVQPIELPSSLFEL